MTSVNDVTGSAEDNTLRFIRVVRHYVWGANDYEELRFESKIEVEEEYFAELERAARALRNMGLGRNRGLGAVRCVLKHGDNHKPSGKGSSKYICMPFTENGRSMVAISYAVQLESNVMLPRGNSTRTSDSIPGSSVLGCFASKLKSDNTFDSIFLKGAVRFSPLYPIDANGKRCVPAPSFVIKVKGGDEDGLYENGLSFTCERGQIAKPLKDGFVSMHSWTPVPVATEVVYHHSREGAGMLYTQQCLCAGQVFAGFIECPVELADDLKTVLEDGELSFGRSKSAQYSICTVKEAGTDFAGVSETIDIVPGGQYAIVLDSDLLLLDGEGRYTTDFSELVKALKKTLPWFGTVDIEFDEEGPDPVSLITNVRLRTVSGYNAKWNLKKPHVQVFEAGSTIILTVPTDAQVHTVPAVAYVGERQAEGFGRVIAVPLDRLEVVNEKDEGGNGERPASDLELIRQRVVCLADNSEAAVNGLNPSFIGRLALMTKESKCLGELRRHINTIKDQEKKDKADELLRKVEEEVGVSHGEAFVLECFVFYLNLLKYKCKQNKETEVA